MKNKKAEKTPKEMRKENPTSRLKVVIIMKILPFLNSLLIKIRKIEFSCFPRIQKIYFLHFIVLRKKSEYNKKSINCFRLEWQ
jgi:hypothetical protein